jgi:PAS domain S-box-containing protein
LFIQVFREVSDGGKENEILKQLSFRQRQLLILIILIIVPMAIGLSISLPSSRGSIIQHMTTQLETVADLKTIQVEQWLKQGHDAALLISNHDDIQEVLNILQTATSPEVRVQAQSNLSTEIEVVTSIFSHIESVSILHPTEGQVLHSTDPGEVGRVRRDEDYFRYGQQGLYVSPVVYSRGSETPALVVSAPIQDEDDELLAVATVEMNLTDLETAFSSHAGLGSTGRAYLVDALGFYVTLPPDFEGSLLRTIAKSKGVSRALAQQTGNDTYLDPRGVQVAGVYRWLPESRLGLLVEMEETELTGQIMSTWMLITLSILGTLVLAIVAARSLTNWLVTPLEQIVVTARALQSGDFSHRASPGGPDEIGQLSAAFNEMADSLQYAQESLEQLVEQRTAELRTANEILKQEIAERKQAEEEGQRLADVVKNMQVGLHLFHLEDINDDRTLRMVATNPAAAQITGVAREEVLGKTLDENFPGLRERGMPQLYANVVRSGKPVELGEVNYGDERVRQGVFSVKAFPLPNNHVGVAFENITQRKQAEEALRESQKQYQILFNSMLDGYAMHEIICDDNGTPIDYKFLNINPAFERFTGLGREIIGKTVLEALPMIEQYWIDTYGKVALTGESIRFENYSQELESWFEVVAFSPAEKQFVTVFQDVTERKQAEKALQEYSERLEEMVEERTVELSESEEKFRRIFEASPIGIELYDAGGSLLDANQACLATFGISDIAEVKGFNLFEDPNVSDEVKEKLYQGEIARYEVLFDFEKVKKLGLYNTYQTEPIYLDVLITPLIPVRKETPGGYLVQLQDITGRKKTEQALRDAQEKLVRKEKLTVLGQLAGSVAHELRNPLGVLNNGVYFLNMILSDADETTKKYMEMISSQIRKSDKIVSDLLSFSRTRLDERAEREEVDVSGLVAQVLVEQPSPEQVAVSNQIDPDLPPVFVDPQQMEQVLTNLVTNAYQAMPEGGKLTIRVKEEKNHVRLSVADTGCGISEEHMAKLFEPLFTTKPKGIGLGLAVCKNLVEANKGRIEVESMVGEGSTFKVYLPLVPF